jgi:hypothetical protein
MEQASRLHECAVALREQGRHAEAARLAQRSVAIMQQVTGSADLELLRIQSLRPLAGISCAQGGYAEAESLYQRALALAEAALGRSHLETAACLNDLAVLYKYTARFTTGAASFSRWQDKRRLWRLRLRKPGPGSIPRTQRMTARWSSASVLRQGHVSMRVTGEWLLCDDGVVRPIMRAKVLGNTGHLTPENFLIDATSVE